MRIKFIDKTEEAVNILSLIQDAVESGELTSFEYDVEAGNYNEGFTGLDAVTNVISLAQIGFDKQVFVFDVLTMGEEVLNMIFDLLEDERVTKLIHNAVFEYMTHLSYDVKIKNFVCTLVAEKLVKAGKKDRGFGLAEIALERLDILLDKTEQKSDWLVRPLRPEQIKYAALDVLYLTDIWESQRSEMRSTDYEIFQLEMDSLEVFAEMQYNGIVFDIGMAEITREEIEQGAEKRLASLQKQLPEVPLPKSAWRVRKDGTKALNKQFKAWPSGFKPVQGTTDIKTAMIQIMGEDNMPTKNVKDSKTGKWKKSVCFDEKHRPLIDHELMPEINEFCKWSVLWTKYIKKITSWPHAVTGKVHYRIDQLKSTGRISVSDPPVQQFPGRGQGAIIRKCFVAEVYKLPVKKVLEGLERFYKSVKAA